jgi:hypothetical protein
MRPRGRAFHDRNPCWLEDVEQSCGVGRQQAIHRAAHVDIQFVSHKLWVQLQFFGGRTHPN